MNVFKELLENCLDSGASKIQIEYHNFGFDRILFVDNGKGISLEDL